MRRRDLAAFVAVAITALLAGVLVGALIVGPPLGAAGGHAGASSGSGASVRSAGPSGLASTDGSGASGALGGSASPSSGGSTAASASSSAKPSPTPAPTFAPLPSGEVPVLYYHRVEATPPDFASWSLADRRFFLAYDVLPATFDAQLGWLQAHGYATILPRDLAAHWDRGTPLPPRPIILTFDDGSPDWATVVGPLLKKHGMVAEFYVTLDHVGKYLTWDDLRALAKAGNAIGAHDVHHVQLTGAGMGGRSASSDTMRYEVGEVRRAITAEIGVAPDSLAYVGGGFDATLIGIVRRAGYTTARSIIRGVKQTQDLRYQLRVSRIGAYDDVRSVLTGLLVAGLPTFQKRVTGVDPG